MSSANSFGTFLETRELLRKQSQQSARQGTGDPQILAAVKILEAPLPAAPYELLKTSGLSMDAFFETLRSLQAEGIVELREEPEGERLDLTARGRELLAD